MKERKTALVLSGGGSRGAYQSGVWQALVELGVDIDIVVGVSVGAINGAMVTQGDMIKTCNLWRSMATDMIFDVNADANIKDFAKEFFLNLGAGSSGLKNMLEKYVDENVVRSAPMDFGLLTVEIPSMTPHYLWREDIPMGQLNDYIVASASAFPAIHAHKIGDKRFIDGGYINNLPVSMAKEKGATHVIAVYLDAVGRFIPSELDEAPNLTFIRSKWDLGDFLAFNVENSARILRLGYLDTMKTFGIYDGEYYTFVKGIFTARNLHAADVAAKIFELDPQILYRRERYIMSMEKAILAERHNMDIDLNISLKSVKALTSLDKLKELLKDNFLKDLARAANRKTLTLIIADNLKAKGKDSIFASRYAKKVLPIEISAAALLVHLDLI